MVLGDRAKGFELIERAEVDGRPTTRIPVKTSNGGREPTDVEEETGLIVRWDINAEAGSAGAFLQRTIYRQVEELSRRDLPALVLKNGIPGTSPTKITMRGDRWPGSGVGGCPVHSTHEAMNRPLAQSNSTLTTQAFWSVTVTMILMWAAVRSPGGATRQPSME